MTKEPSQKIANQFFQAFQRIDGDAMANCYHPEASFSDPVFPSLKGEDVRHMWRMLCRSAKGMTVEYQIGDMEKDRITVTWQASYKFSKTGRSVLNCVTSHITVKDGLIYSQRDHFDFWKWSRQALGPVGWLLGWSPIVRNKVRATAAATLESYIKGAAPTT